MDCVKIYLQLAEYQKTEIVLNQEDLVAINLQVQNFITLSGGDVLNYFSYEINIPYAINANALGHVIDKNVKGNDLLRCGRIPARIECGVISFEGNLKFSGWAQNCKIRTLTAQFVGGIDNWTNCLQGVNICDLDLGLFDPSEQAIYDNMDLLGPYDGQINYWTSLKYFGGLSGLTEIPTKYHRPDIYDAAIIDAINKLDCPKIKGEILGTEFFRRNLFVNAKQGFNYTALTYTSTLGQLTGVNTQYLHFQNDWTTPGSNAGIDEIQIQEPGIGTLITAFIFDQGVNGVNGNIKRDLEVCFKFKGDLVVLGGSENLLIKEIEGVTSGAPQTKKIYTGPEVVSGYNEVEFCINVFNWVSTGTLTGYAFGLSGNVSIAPGAELSICLQNADLATNVEPFALNQFLPCVPVIDYLKDISTQYNLIPFYDQKNNCIALRPAWDATLSPTGENVQGFYLGPEKAKDITSEVECAINSGDFKQSQNDCIRFLFCKDGADEYVNAPFKDSEDTYLGDLRCNNLSGDNASILKIETNVVSATRSGDLPSDVTISGLSPVVPYILNTDPGDASATPELAYNMKPRRLYKCDKVLGNWSHPDPANSSLIIDETEYPYATQLDVAKGVNLGWADANGVPGLASTFYGKTIKMQKESGTNLQRWRPEKKDLIDLETFFRTPYRIKDKVTGDRIFILSALQQYVLCSRLLAQGNFIEYPE